jgi:hypothetical protein
LRNLALAVLRSEGVRDIAAAFRERAADAAKAVRRIGLLFSRAGYP